MGRFIVNGGNKLSGSLEVSGAKNEALKIIPLAILVNSEFIVDNVPDIADIRKQLEIFEDLGGKYEFKNSTLKLDGRPIAKATLKNGLATKLRASIVYIGPLLAKFKKVTVPFPGGCAIGRRPIDSHLRALKALGAKIQCEGETYKITFEEFISSRVTLTEPSVTATENILMFLSYFEEEFEVHNCAIEPEIMALADVLNKAGAKIELIGERSFKISGSRELSLDTIEVIPDRIEAFSYLIAFLVTGGSGTIKNFPAYAMKEPLKVLKDSGASFKFDENKIEVLESSRFKPFTIETAPYPGFPTDMQSPMSLVACLAEGESIINETMFENRLTYIDELKKMGLKAEATKHRANIKGPAKLEGAKIVSLDLRSGITLVLAALMAEGKSTIENSEIIDRGYENLIEKLSSVGAEITRND